MILALLCLLTVLLAALFAGLETGVYSTSRLRIVLDAAAGHPAARHAQRLLADMPQVLAVLLLGTNAAHWAASFLAQRALAAGGVDEAALVGTLLVTTVLFVLGEAVPKNAFRRRQHALLYPAMPLLRLAMVLLGWLARPLAALGDLAARRVRQRRPAAPSAGERETLLATGVAEGFLTPFQARVASGVLSMRSRTAGEEARPVAEYPTAHLGVPGVELPAGSLDHRVLVLDEAGRRIAGWVPLAALWSGGSFRGPSRRDLLAVARVEAGTSLDRVYTALDRSGAPFAAVAGPERARWRATRGCGCWTATASASGSWAPSPSARRG